MSSQKLPRSLRGLPQCSSLVGTVGLVSAALASSITYAAEPAPHTADKADIEEMVIEGEKAGRNPYADPVAPYKIDRSASSKLTQSILDAAKSITVIPKELIDDTGTNTFRDLMRVQPGVTLGTGEGGNAFGDRVFIRGFDARNDIYIDGVRDPGVTSRETFAIDQIEIFKGPSSAFGGRGTTGGAVSMISKAPQDENFGDAEITLGTDNTRRGTLDVNRVLTDKLSVRVNAMYHESDVAGRDEVYSDRWGAAIAAAYKVTDAAKITVDYYHLETDALPDWGVAYDVANNEPFDVDRHNFYGLVERDFHKNNANILTARLEADLTESLSLRSVVRYGSTWNAYVVSAPERPDVSDPDPANWTVSASPKNRNQTNKYLSSQTDLTWRTELGGMRHTFVTGVEYSNEKIENHPYAFLDSEDPSTGDVVSVYTVLQNLWNPDPFQEWVFGREESGAYTKSDIDTKAIFLIDTIEITDKVQVFGGIRYDDYQIEYTSVGGRSGDSTFNSDMGFWNWHAGVTYKPRDNGNIYVSFGSSSNPPGEQVDGGGAAYGGITASNEDLAPERNKSYELGTKWALFDEHLLVSAAVFRIDKVDGRVTSGGRGEPEVTTLDGRQRVDGLEIGFSGNVSERLSLFGGLTLLDTEILASNVTTDIGGKLPNVAETSFTVLAKYKMGPGLDVGGSVNYSSKVYGGTSSAGTTFLPSYWRFDVFASYQLTEKVGVSLNVQNLTDEVYYDSLYRSSAPFTYIAPGRSALITLDVDF
ncbi:TonB-dependent receptor [Kordiimonas pumila]|uniref:TonB-dependent receptor n=1 Tax=Kordiimonas pumila TaxID=2161677 RepID=A0ABV7D909_9PROT|nr:TonB-dependent siderophore receptor [Kordiimonas pumila]